VELLGLVQEFTPAHWQLTCLWLLFLNESFCDGCPVAMSDAMDGSIITVGGDLDGLAVRNACYNKGIGQDTNSHQDMDIDVLLDTKLINTGSRYRCV